MSKRMTKLHSTLLDLRSRLGDGDPMVAEVQAEIDRCQAAVDAQRQQDRRKAPPPAYFWNHRVGGSNPMQVRR